MFDFPIDMFMPFHASDMLLADQPQQMRICNGVMGRC